MATVYDVMGALETLYPLRYAEDWDHPGLIVGDLRNTVNNIVFAADPTMEVVEDAIASGADMLVTTRCSSAPCTRFQAAHSAGA